MLERRHNEAIVMAFACLSTRESYYHISYHVFLLFHISPYPKSYYTLESESTKYSEP